MNSSYIDKKFSADRVVVTSFFVNVIDIIINLVMFLSTGSVIMFAELLQGIADLVSIGTLWIGLKNSRRKPDKFHIFGYGKEIYFWALLSAVIIITVTATASIYFGVLRIFKPEEISYIFLVFVALIISLVSNGYSLSLSFRRLLEGKPWRNVIMAFTQSNKAATKNAFVLDLMGTLAAGLGLVSVLLYQLFGDVRFDAIGAISIGVMTLVLGVVLVFGIKSFIVGKGASKDTEEKIKAITLEIPGVLAVLDLKTMQIGPESLLVNIEIHARDGLDTDSLEVLIDKIKHQLVQKLPAIKHVQIELETPDNAPSTNFTL